MSHSTSRRILGRCQVRERSMGVHIKGDVATSHLWLSRCAPQRSEHSSTSGRARTFTGFPAMRKFNRLGCRGWAAQPVRRWNEAASYPRPVGPDSSGHWAVALMIRNSVSALTGKPSSVTVRAAHRALVAQASQRLYLAIRLSPKVRKSHFQSTKYTGPATACTTARRARDP